MATSRQFKADKLSTICLNAASAKTLAVPKCSQTIIWVFSKQSHAPSCYFHPNLSWNRVVSARCDSQIKMKKSNSQVAWKFCKNSKPPLQRVSAIVQQRTGSTVSKYARECKMWSCKVRTPLPLWKGCLEAPFLALELPSNNSATHN